MDNQHHHQEHFDSVFPIYYTRLKGAYDEGVKSSYNKEYAAGHFRSILCEQNTAIPTKTVFFDELRTLFDHFYNLLGNAAVSRIVEHFEAIREQSQDALDRIEIYSAGSYELDFFQLPVHYDTLLNEGADVHEIIEQERRVLELTDQQVIELLALYAASQKLGGELRPGTASPEGEPLQESDRKDRFTRPQQVLIFHFLMEATGCNSNAASITDFARLLHKFIGVSEPKNIANSDLYKMLKKPFGEYDQKTLLDLRAFLPYFEKLPHYPIINEINRHILSCNGD
jgi:hypothetical protein